MYWGYPGIRSPLLTVRFHRIFSFWFSYFFVISETFSSYFHYTLCFLFCKLSNLSIFFSILLCIFSFSQIYSAFFCFTKKFLFPFSLYFSLPITIHENIFVINNTHRHPSFIYILWVPKLSRPPPPNLILVIFLIKNIIFVFLFCNSRSPKNSPFHCTHLRFWK